MLQDRFFAHGQEVPTEKSWVAAAQSAYKAAKASFENRDSMVTEAVDRFCESEAPARRVNAGLIEVKKEASHMIDDVKTSSDMKSEMRIEIRILSAVLLLDKVLPFVRQRLSSGKASNEEPALS